MYPQRACKLCTQHAGLNHSLCVQGRGHALYKTQRFSFVDSWGPCKDFGLVLLIALGTFEGFKQKVDLGEIFVLYWVITWPLGENGVPCSRRGGWGQKMCPPIILEGRQ